MSGFSPELIDYLEGKISFEEFERLREERKALEREAIGDGATEDEAEVTAVEDRDGPSKATHSRTKQQGDDLEETSDGVRKSVHRVFASMFGDHVSDDDEEEQEQSEQLSAGEVFALEMELHREHKKMQRERRPRSKLPKALRGLMGEANIRFARGDREEAVMMCMEIIRQDLGPDLLVSDDTLSITIAYEVSCALIQLSLSQRRLDLQLKQKRASEAFLAPLAYEPFSTLAMIYEDQGDMEKSLQFGLIAAHLNPSDPEEWVKLAEMSLEQDNIKQAIFCYSKAIKYDTTNVRYLWERCSLYEQLGEHKLAMDGYRRILNILPPTDGEHFMQLARDMAKSYYETNDITSAIGVMEEALGKHQNLVSAEDVNMAAELYLSSKQYDKALETITKFTEVVVEKIAVKQDLSEETTEDVTYNCQIPETVPIDIRVKLIVCLIHLHILQPLDLLMTNLMEQNPEDMGDLYLDVAEAFLEIGEYNSALPLLSALVCSERYNLAVVWLRHAECLKALGHMELAAESYTKVVAMAPLHLDARISLSTLQQQLGRPEKALEALESMHDPETLTHDANAAQQELKLLLHRSTLLYSQKKLPDYVDALLAMLAMLLKVAMNRAQVSLISRSKNGEKHLFLAKDSRDKVSDIDDQEAAYLDVKGKTSVLNKDDWWNLLLKAVYTLCDLKRFKEAELLVDSSLEYYSFYDDRQKRKELEYFGLSAAVLDNNFRKAYNYIRVMVMENVNRPQLWNIFNQVTMHSQDLRHHRFCLRLMLKHPDNHALCVLNGHNAFVAGSFKHALGQYVQAFRIQPSEPLYSLCVGLTFIHMASQKFVLKRHPLLVQGFSFLTRYMELRGPCQEVYYNIGRALHQLGLVHFAVHYYEKALELPPLQLEGIDDDQVDLRRDIAYNLSLIYQNSGNIDMARKLIYTHCVV